MQHETAAHQHHQEAHAPQKRSMGIDYKRYTPYLLPFAIYLVIALINFWPVTLGIATTVAGYGGDPYQMLWHLWWVPYSTFSGQSMWYTNLIFYPLGANLIYETMIPIASLLASPLQLVSLPFEYNFIFFAGFALSGMAMFVLAKYITKSTFGAFLAGLVFSFSTFHIAQSYGHLQYANLEWVPLAVYFFIRMLNGDGNRIIDSLLLAITFVLLLFTTAIDVGVITLTFLALIFIVYIIDGSTRKSALSLRFFKSVAITAVLTLIIGSWAFIPIITGLSASGLSTVNSLNDISHNMLWSDDLLSFFLPSFFNGIFNTAAASYAGIYHLDFNETASYIGYTVLALSVLGVRKNLRASYLWIAAIVIFFIMSLGPYIQVNTYDTGIPGLYLLFKSIPLLSIVREPGRFDLIVSLAFAVLVAFGGKALNDMIKARGGSEVRRNQYIVLAVVGLLFLFESNGMPLSGVLANDVTINAAIPQFYAQALPTIRGNFTVLPLPISPNPYSFEPSLYPAQAMYYMTASHRQMIGGDATRENNSQLLSVYQIPLALQATNVQEFANLSYSSPLNQNAINQTLLTLYNYNTGLVVLNKDAYNSTYTLPLMENYLFNIFGNPVYNDNQTMAFGTTAAVGNSLFRSFVGYPVLTYWSFGAVPIAGRNVSVWVPNNPGEIVVYAPYPTNVSASSAIGTGATYIVNASMSFTAFAVSGVPESPLDIYEQVGNGNLGIADVINATAIPKSYTLPMKFQSGPIGNRLLFISGTGQSSNGTVAVMNITISRAK